MINNKLLLAAGVATLSASFFATNVIAATATGNASVTVLTPISIVETTAMFFGEVAGDAQIGTTVTLDTSNGTSPGIGASATGTPASGAFTVTGEGSLSYSVTLPTSATLTGPGSPGTDMTVTSFSDDSGGALSSGTDTFNVGGVLNINSNQGAGSYSGTYTMTVNYN